MEYFVTVYLAEFLRRDACPPTFLLPSEGHQVIPVLVLQGRLLQVLLQGVTVKWTRWALLRLVTLPEASRQHGILGEQGVKCYFTAWMD